MPVGQLCFSVEVVDGPIAEPIVLFQLFSVHAETGHASELSLGGEMRYPGRHEVEDVDADGELIAVELSQSADRGVVDVRDDSRRSVEELVG